MPPSTNIQFAKKDHRILVVVLLSVALALAVGAAVWGIINYIDQKTDVDSRVAEAVAVAKKEQADELEAKFAVREKDPNYTFAGPDDFGRLTFKYPKNWSVYVDKEISSGGEYKAYLNPGTVPPVSASSARFGLRVLIETEDYDKVVKSYEQLVKKGDLRSSATSFNGNSGIRLEGNFNKDIRGLAVIFKIRDKTATLRTDANTFKSDFDKIISTVTFNR